MKFVNFPFFSCFSRGELPASVTNDLIFQANIYEPVANGQQLIGDDFFLQLAIRNLHLPIWRYKGERSFIFVET